MRIQMTRHSFSVGSIIAAVAMIFGVANALGESLSVIPVLTGDTANSGRAITPDGQYLVGLSGSRGFLYQTYGVGFSGNAINVLSGDNAQSTIANGIGYRTSGGNTELVVSGNTSSGPAEFMTVNGGTSWGAKRRNSSTTFSPSSMGAANQLGSRLGTDVYYVSSSKDAQNQPVWLNQGSGAWVASIAYSSKGLSGGDRGIMYGVSSIGRAVGRRGGTSASYKAYVLDYAAGTPANYYINTLNDGLNGATTTLGELWSVSGNGKALFGRSFLTGTSGTYYGFKTTLSGSGAATQGAVNTLPLLPGTAGSTSLQVPYGASWDGSYAVGMDYVGTEKAALWDTSDPNPANWTVTDLTVLASSLGILDGFTRLSRAYSIGVVPGSGEKVVTGEGVWSPDGGTTLFTRAFVMVIPEPGTISLLALGLFGLLALRRRK
jgi:hypothetical protein